MHKHQIIWGIIVLYYNHHFGYGYHLINQIMCQPKIPSLKTRVHMAEKMVAKDYNMSHHVLTIVLINIDCIS